MRQDPDIIMIGEIRDAITASIAMRSAITGHLVLTTLHTNDAIGSIARLRDMGVEDFMISAALKGVISQRLVRRLCPNCKQSVKINNADAKILNLPTDTIVYESHGCELCNNIGYKGRLALYEYLLVDEKMCKLIENKNTDFKSYLLEKNFSTLKDNAIKNVLLGNTSINEIYKKIILEE